MDMIAITFKYEFTKEGVASYYETNPKVKQHVVQ